MIQPGDGFIPVEKAVNEVQDSDWDEQSKE